MTKRLVDVENSNRLLFDLLFRHQVYLEGVKAGVLLHFRKMIVDLYGEFAKFIGQSQYDKLDEFSRVEIEHFVFRFQQAQRKTYNSYTQQLIALLQQFLDADHEVTTAIYGVVNDHPKAVKTTKQSIASAPVAALSWTAVANEIVPASGMTVTEMLNNFATSSTNRVANQVRIGYANGETTKAALSAIAGSHDNRFRDGLLSVFANQNAALTATILQFVSSQTQAAIAQSFYSKYQWVAILDSRTSQICLSRDGKVYVYGEGPLPPAHYNCRSKAVSLTEGDDLHDLPNSFYDWAVTQPDDFLIDALGATLAAKFIARDNSAKDISVNDAATPLTVSQFRDKISLITM